jgi:beta-lactamase class A
MRTLVLVLLVLLLFCTGVTIYALDRNAVLIQKNNLLKNYNPDLSMAGDYATLSSDAAWLNADNYLDKQRNSTMSYTELKTNLNFIVQNANGDYSMYFEDLNTGAWIGVKEDEPFMPLSLLKVPMAISALKDVERGTAYLDQKVVLDKEDIDARSGIMWEKGAGYETDVKELLTNLIKHSDNTALVALSRHVVSEQTYMETKLVMGLPPLDNNTIVSPKQYSNMLRGLYFSTYLRKPFSELTMAIMMETDFTSQIPAGVPKDVRVAHKVGVYNLEGYYHDCGIVFANSNPYILCVMSKNTNAAEADRVISQISRIIYNYVESKYETAKK